MKVNCDIQTDRFNPIRIPFKLIGNLILGRITELSSPRVAKAQSYIYQIALVVVVALSQTTDLWAQSFSDEGPDAGPAFDHFSLTLDIGDRQEWLGPLFFRERKGEATGWGIPPLITWTEDSGTESAELDILYPVLTYDRFGSETRWQLFQWINFSGNQTLEDSDKRRLNLFPFYFQQRSKEPTNNYTAFFPFYGTFKNRFFRDEVHFVMLPLYVQSQKRGVTTDNYLYPFFHLRSGAGVNGWQFWPVIGNEHKPLTQRTNMWDELEDIPGHQKFFFAWPFFMKERERIGTSNELHTVVLAPLFSSERSPQRDSWAFPWPIGLRRTIDREKDYREWDAPWPFVVFARGKGKHTDRVWPLFSQSESPTLRTAFYLWPFYRGSHVNAPPFARDHHRFLIYLYTDLRERNVDTGEELHRMNAWPLFSFRRDFQGRKRLQILAPLEPLLPTSKSIERDYSPVWSLWRSETNPKTSAHSESLLWNLYRRETSPTHKKCSLLFGLFQYQTGAEGKRMKLFYCPIGKSGSAHKPVPRATPEGNAPQPKPTAP